MAENIQGLLNLLGG
jgi:hypothetical protein